MLAKERAAKRAKLNEVVNAAIAALQSMDDDAEVEVLHVQLAADEEWGIDLKGFSSHHGAETFYLYKQKIE